LVILHSWFRILPLLGYRRDRTRSTRSVGDDARRLSLEAGPVDWPTYAQMDGLQSRHPSARRGGTLCITTKWRRSSMRPAVAVEDGERVARNDNGVAEDQKRHGVTDESGRSKAGGHA
jgi:hypothetical protein